MTNLLRLLAALPWSVEPDQRADFGPERDAPTPVYFPYSKEAQRSLGDKSSRSSGSSDLGIAALVLIFVCAWSLSAYAEFEDQNGSESSEESFEEEFNESGSATGSGGLTGTGSTKSGSQKSKSFKTYKTWEKKKTGQQQIQRQEPNDEEKPSKYFIEDTKRVDAGVFHVGFALGGNFYIEPKFDANNVPLGEYFKDFGFQGGVYFDYDYDDMALGLRGFAGYKYILNSVHVFAAEFCARLRLAFSDNANFAVGLGPGATMWFRQDTTQTQGEEVLFVPFIIFSAGFDFNPFMVDFKFPIHRIGTNTTILGVELYFGFRL